MTGPVPRARLALALAVCLLLPACIKNKVTKANYDSIKEGMTLAEVEKLLGKGTKDEGDGTNVAAQFGVHVEAAPRSGSGTTYTWERGGNSITVFFNKEGKVANKRASGF